MNEFSLSSFYNQRVEEFGHHPNAVGWRSEEQQQLRFKVLLDNLAPNDMSVLDLGCGFGDFYSFLLSLGNAPSKYLGVDISSKMIDLASKSFEHEPKVQFMKCDFFKYDFAIFDLVVLSGALNYTQEIDKYDYLEIFIQKFSRHVSKVLSFNLLSDSVDYEQDHHQHFNIDKVVVVISKYFPKVRVIRNYGLYEFTVQCAY